MNTPRFFSLLLASASFGLNGCTAMHSLVDSNAEPTAVAPASTAEPLKPVALPCERDERDLTRPWALRRYWCDGQVQAASPQTPKSVTASLSAPAVGTRAVRNAITDAMPRPAPNTRANPASRQVPHNIWFARGNPDLGPDGLRRTAKLAEQFKRTLREGQIIWLRGSTQAAEVDDDDQSVIEQLSFDRAWAVHIALRAKGVKSPIRIRRPNGVLYGRKVLVSVL